MKKVILASDFDGVLADSLTQALRLTKMIVNLFEEKIEIKSFQDFYKYIGRKSVMQISPMQTSKLREIYRILYEYHYRDIKVNKEIIKIYSRLKSRPIIVSSSFSSAIKKILGNRIEIFSRIYGYENGKKRTLLEKLAKKGSIIYVTDTYRDLDLCNTIGINSVATTWGYDDVNLLTKHKPTYVVNSKQEFIKLLDSLSLLHKKS